MKISFWVFLFIFGQLKVAYCIEDSIVHVKSLENKDCFVNLHNIAGEDILEITLNNSHNSLYIHEFRGLDGGIEVLDNRFVKLRIEQRGGTGVRVRRTVVICVKNGKLYDVLDFISQVKSYTGYSVRNNYDIFENHEISLYPVKGNKFSKYRLAIESIDYANYKYKRSENRNKKHNAILNFDEKNICFYNKVNTLTGKFILTTDADSYTSENSISVDWTTVPTFNIDGNIYYYKESTWYSGGKGHLLKLDVICK